MTGPAKRVAVVLAKELGAGRSYQEEARRRDLAAEPLRGLAVAGPAGWVRSLMGSLERLR